MKGKSIFLLLVLALLTLLAVVAIWTQIIPQYRARGEVRISPFKPHLVFKTEESGMIPFYESFVNTQVSVIKCPRVLGRVLDHQDVRNMQWFKNPPKTLKQRLLSDPTDPPMERLKEALSVRPRRNTEIIDVSFMDAVAKDAQIIVNAVLDQYLKYILEASDEESEELYRKLVEIYNSLKTEIDLKQTILINLRKELRTAEPQELISAMRVRLDQKQTRLKDLQNLITIVEKTIEQAKLANSNEVPFGSGLGDGPDYSTDPKWEELNESVRALKHQLVTSRLKPKHSDYILIEEELEFAVKSLRLREELLQRRWRDRTGNKVGLPPTEPNVGGYMPGTKPGEFFYDSVEGLTLEGRLALAQEEERQLSDEVEKDQKELGHLLEKAQEYDHVTAQLLEKRQLFDAVRRRKEQKDMERNVPSSMGISILSRAAIPTEPDNDRRILYTAIVLALYLTVGSCIAILGRKRETEKEKKGQ